MLSHDPTSHESFAGSFANLTLNIEETSVKLSMGTKVRLAATIPIAHLAQVCATIGRCGIPPTLSTAVYVANTSTMASEYQATRVLVSATRRYLCVYLHTIRSDCRRHSIKLL